MYQYSNNQLADMHLAYGAANCNASAAALLYHERYPARHRPEHRLFTRIHQRLSETGSFIRQPGRPLQIDEGRNDTSMSILNPALDKLVER